ncbi:hypothetical protein BH10PSE19_BH10PSE19_19280 [soil metagenome]
MRKILISCIILLVVTPAFAADDAAEKKIYEQGQKIYEKACKTCHASGTAELMASPVVHNKAAWDERIRKAELAVKNEPQYKTALDYLVATVKAGKGAMLPGGLCVDESYEDKKCNDADYLAAIKFMITPEKTEKVSEKAKE